MKSKFFFLILSLSLIFLYIYFQSQKVGLLIGSQQTSLLKELPDTALKMISDEPTSLHQLLANNSSKLILVHFWATWCGPCETEMPGFLEFLKKIDREVVKVLFIASNDRAGQIDKFFKKHGGLPDKITLLIDNDDAYSMTFGAARVPETFLFNSQKQLVKQFSGPQDWNNPYYFSLFQDLSK